MDLDELAAELRRLGDFTFRARHDAPVLLYEGDRDVEESASFRTELAPRISEASSVRAAPRRKSTQVFPIQKREGGPFEDRIGLGRARNADVHVPLAQLSKYHAYFVIEAGVVSVADAGSKNGTFVDGARLLPRTLEPLRDGAELQLGPYVFRFHSVDGLVTLLSRLPSR